MDERLYSSPFCFLTSAQKFIKNSATSSFVFFKSLPLSNSFAEQYWSRTILAASTHCFVFELSRSDCFQAETAGRHSTMKQTSHFRQYSPFFFLSKQTVVTSLKPEIKHRLQSLSIFFAGCHKNQVQFISKKFLKPEASICRHFEFFSRVRFSGH